VYPIPTDSELRSSFAQPVGDACVPTADERRVRSEQGKVDAGI
jgi:hypothetical protein